MTLATKFFKEVLGLEKDAIDKALSTIRATGSGQNLSDANIRRKIGPTAWTMIHKGFDAAGDPDVDHDDDDHGQEEFNSPDNYDANGKMRKDKVDSERRSRKFEGVSFTLKDYLINETSITMDVDTDDPNAAVQDVRKKARVASASPARASQMEIKAARDKKKAAAADDTPNSGVKKQIAATQERLAMLNKRLRDSEKRAG